MSAPTDAERRAARVIPPRQQRSRETMDRVLAATADLLRERAFAEVSVAAIGERAGVSVGSVYARFADKEAVLRTLEQTLRDGALASAEASLGAPRWAGVDLDGLIRGFVGNFFEADRRTANLTRAFALHAQADPGYRADYLEGREEILRAYRTRFVERVLERRAEVATPHPAQAAGVAFDLLIAVSEQRLFLPGPELDAATMADLLLAYLLHS